jgi:hypothetical protein
MVVAIIALILGLLGTAIAAGPLTKKKVNKIITKRAPGLTVGAANKAGTADNANALGGQAASAFRTASASDVRTDNVAAEGSVNPALSVSITTTGTKTLTAFATVEAVSDGGTDDNINCQITIDGMASPHVVGTYVTPNALDNRTTVPVTWALQVSAGTHTVSVGCGDGIGSDTTLDDRALSVVATN